MNHLIIVESPAKAKTLKKFLGAKYAVKASMGHIRDLPKKTMAIDIEHDFAPQYEISPDKKKIVKDLKDAVHKAPDTVVWLAPDEDREGESIAWHLVYALGLKKGQFRRIAFHEITKPAVLKALENPRAIDINLVHAQQARRILDRLVGYRLSPLLWTKIRAGLSAGRVQSVAVRLIVDREREIEAFKTEEYWKIDCDLSVKKGPFNADLSKIKGKKAEVKNKKKADEVLKDLNKAKYEVTKIEKKFTKRSPTAPFITSTLQQEASRKLGFSVKQTMVVAQQLYEGVEHGQHHTGLITYMRTDSYNLSYEFLKTVPKIITRLYGAEYALSKPRIFTKKARGAQEAHEAIRPTDPSKTPKDLKSHLDPKQYRLYKLIWERTIACQMADAEVDVTTAIIKAGDYELIAKGEVIRKAGFMKAYVEGTDDAEEALSQKEVILPEMKEGETCNLKKVNTEQKFTQPPPRYTEASLVKKLESEGIGRPSTYAPTISTIISRGYIEKKPDKKLYPMDIGMIVNDFLVKHFPDIVDYQFTARMEENLDDIAEGKTQWQPIIKEFYEPFEKTVEKKKKEVKKSDVIHEKTDEKCDVCGAPMVVKLGKNGKFLSCSKYPECKNARPMKEDAEKEEKLQKEFKDEKCDKCGSPMIVKNGRFGEFLACSGYPKCKTTRPLSHALKVKCPECGSDIVEKRTKRGKIFYGCTGYPACKFATWKKPVDDKCPVCGGIQLQEKKNLTKCQQCGKETETE
ncbi:type I DNA topoisomerase [Patescibacteria group bacterium]|nr:type I DNA topoisomerase [Patescibacteria group bacterium]MBU1016132.1 type I DNA topoisomerase [Patescibacteria group bacterium]MBU1684875.1 type I DNA topoisomerase [Patescibacteria group bacterium]MBU1938591.1 type I DNA topoisomerase [Patescibacteria group bacterium]